MKMVQRTRHTLIDFDTKRIRVQATNAATDFDCEINGNPSPMHGSRNVSFSNFHVISLSLSLSARHPSPAISHSFLS